MAILSPILGPSLGPALTPITQAGAGGWTPALWFLASEQGVWYDPSDMSTMFQDSAGTTPVTAAGQVVGKILDKSGRGNHATQATTAQKPTLQTNGTLWWLQFDGVDDNLVTAAIDFTATDKMTVVAGVRKNSDGLGMLVELSANFNSNNGAFFIYGDSGYTTGSKGNLSSGAVISGAFAAPSTDVLTLQASIALDQAVFRVDGVQRASSATDQGTGNYGNHALYIGRRGGTSLPFNGYLYSLIVRGAATDDVTPAETYTAGKTGVTLP